MKKAVMISLAIWGLGLLLGFSLLRGVDVSSQQLESLSIESTSFWTILANNLIACFIMIIGCGVLTIPYGFFQGFQIGLLASLYLGFGYSFSSLLALILPHGMFELPAMILSMAMGIRLGLWLWQNLKREDAAPFFGSKNYLWILAILFLLVLSACIEAYGAAYIYNNYVV